MIHIPRLQMKNILHYLMLPGTIQTSTNITNDVVIIGNPSFQVDFLEPTLLLQDGPCKCTGRRVSKCKCFSHQRSRQSPARDEAPANSRAGTRYKCKRNHENYCARYTSLTSLLRIYCWMLLCASLQYSEGNACQQFHQNGGILEFHLPFVPVPIPSPHVLRWFRCIRTKLQPLHWTKSLEFDSLAPNIACLINSFIR